MVEVKWHVRLPHGGAGLYSSGVFLLDTKIPIFFSLSALKTIIEWNNKKPKIKLLGGLNNCK